LLAPPLLLNCDPSVIGTRYAARRAEHRSETDAAPHSDEDTYPDGATEARRPDEADHGHAGGNQDEADHGAAEGSTADGRIGIGILAADGRGNCSDRRTIALARRGHHLGRSNSCCVVSHVHERLLDRSAEYL
jgi:hypothetical protein